MLKSLFSSGSSQSSSGDGSGGASVEKLRDMIEAVVKTLVDDSSKIELKDISDSERIAFELRVAKSDLGKVIGKKGRTASALRTLLSAAARKHQMASDLKIID